MMQNKSVRPKWHVVNEQKGSDFEGKAPKN